MAIPFLNQRLAQIACNSLCADPEPPRSTVTKELSVSRNELRVVFCSENIKSLRVSFNNFMDLLMLCMEYCKMSMPSLSIRMKTLTVDQNHFPLKSSKLILLIIASFTPIIRSSFLHHCACLNAYHSHVVLIHYQEFRKHNLFAEIYALKMQNLYRSSDLDDAVLKVHNMRI
ncbi:L antigen family member 3, partial [Trichinella papuae]